MALSKETTDQIRKEASDYSDSIMPSLARTDLQKGYEKGAERWAIWKEKAEWYRSTLDKIANGYVGYSSASQMAKEALEK